MKTAEDIFQLLENISDPEVPVLSIIDLGIVREVKVGEHEVEVIITPTYSGCPAMGMIAVQIKMELLAQGFENVKITESLSPAWTTDWISEEGKQQLKDYGIAPPQYDAEKKRMETEIICPLCESKNTALISQFGSTSCKALYKCLDCLEPFDYFKCH